MIPQFPDFKKIELSDKEEIESFTRKFPPYSDFNFISMWSWDVKEDMRVSWINGNLAVRFSGYLNGEAFYSFLGNNMVTETARALVEVSKLLGPKSEINLVPEVAVKELDPDQFMVEEERDQFDYIYELDKISALQGSIFAKKRNNIKNFLAKNEDVQVRALDITNPDTKFNIKKLNLIWLDQKTRKDPYFEIKNELIAMDNFFEGKFTDNILAIGIFIKGEMIGYSISEKLDQGYAMSHFTKANFAYRGVYDYIMQENAKMLVKEGISLLNYEQDLGLSGLKESKEGFSTGMFLKQYRVMLQ